MVYNRELHSLIEKLEKSRQNVRDLEENIRQIALEGFNNTGNKHPHPAVTICRGDGRRWLARDPYVKIAKDLSGYV